MMRMSVFGFVSLINLYIASSASACDRCVRESKVAFFSKAQVAVAGGACGYGSLSIGFSDGRIAAAAPSIYKEGGGCGACFQIRCRDHKICSRQGTTVTVTDRNNDTATDFVLSTRAFTAMANQGMGQQLLKLGTADVQYRRIACDYKKKNMGIRVEESSKKAEHLAIKLLYQGGQTEIVGIDVAAAKAQANWNYMSRTGGGAVWETSKVPAGALQMRFLVTQGYDGKYVWAKSVLPADWVNGATYDSGIQITDIAQEGCPVCDDGSWSH